jgi:hypothetical protein
MNGVDIIHHERDMVDGLIAGALRPRHILSLRIAELKQINARPLTRKQNVAHAEVRHAENRLDAGISLDLEIRNDFKRAVAIQRERLFHVAHRSRDMLNVQVSLCPFHQTSRIAAGARIRGKAAILDFRFWILD